MPRKMVKNLMISLPKLAKAQGPGSPYQLTSLSQMLRRWNNHFMQKHLATLTQQTRFQSYNFTDR